MDGSKMWDRSLGLTIAAAVIFALGVLVGMQFAYKGAERSGGFKAMGSVQYECRVSG